MGKFVCPRFYYSGFPIGFLTPTDRLLGEAQSVLTEDIRPHERVLSLTSYFNAASSLRSHRLRRLSSMGRVR